MPIKIAKVIRDERGLMTQMVQHEVPGDSLEDFAKHEFLEAFRSRDQPRFDALIKRRVAEAVAGIDWRHAADLERAVRAEQEKMNSWLREDWEQRVEWEQRGVDVGFGDDETE